MNITCFYHDAQQGYVFGCLYYNHGSSNIEMFKVSTLKQHLLTLYKGLGIEACFSKGDVMILGNITVCTHGMFSVLSVGQLFLDTVALQVASICDWLKICSKLHIRQNQTNTPSH